MMVLVPDILHQILTPLPPLPLINNQINLQLYIVNITYQLRL